MAPDRRDGLGEATDDRDRGHEQSQEDDTASEERHRESSGGPAPDRDTMRVRDVAHPGGRAQGRRHRVGGQGPDLRVVYEMITGVWINDDHHRIAVLQHGHITVIDTSQTQPDGITFECRSSEYEALDIDLGDDTWEAVEL